MTRRPVNVHTVDDFSVSIINWTAPRLPIPVPGDHVSFSDDTRKLCSPDNRL